MGTTTEDLIRQAASAVHRQWIGDRLLGDVGCALLTEQSHIYLGVCLDTGSGTGFCAETSAIAAMVTAGEVRIKQIVAVWKDEHGGVYVLSPCGRCRELMRQLHAVNLQTEVVLGANHVVMLSMLLPHPNQFTAVELPEA